MKENRKAGRWVADIALMILVFLVIQTVVQAIAALVYGYVNHVEASELLQQMAGGQQGSLIAACSVMSSLVTIMLYPRLKWTPIDRSYLRSHPWATLLWCVTLTLGTILPFQWLYEQMQIQMPQASQALFESVMKEPWGYVALGILVPVAEEFVFRGGVLRALFALMGERRHWLAIILSALIFGALHLNLAQGAHGFVMGLLLGWLYYRTGSMVPGIIVHWVNNSVAYFMFALMPGMADGKLIDLFHGSQRMMLCGLLCSLCILIPSLFQIALRTKK